VFLLTGPATNAATITMIWKLMGKKSTLLYLSIVCVSAIGSGLLINFIFTHSTMSALDIHLHSELGIWKQVSAVILLLILGYAWMSGRRQQLAKPNLAPEDSVINLRIKGMSCNSCVTNVKKALIEVAGVSNVEIILALGSASITGRNFHFNHSPPTVHELGYQAEEVIE